MDYSSQLAASRQAQKLKIKKRREKKKENIDFPFLEFMIALGNDISDWAIIGSIPIFGDIFDILTTAFLFLLRMILGTKKFGKQSLVLGGATALELIPGGDILPSYSMAVLFNWWREKR